MTDSIIFEAFFEALKWGVVIGGIWTFLHIIIRPFK